MTLTITTFQDLLQIVETHPEWRRKLVKVLFPEIDLPRTLQELAASQQRTEAAIEQLTKLVSRLTTNYEQLDTRASQLETGVDELKTDVGELKGTSHEQYYHNRAVSIFGRYVKRGRDMTNEIADHLQAAEDAGQISKEEFDQVLAADLLWGGRLRKAEGKVILVVEASWLAEITDVERAVVRATILQKTGLTALPVVAGREWTPAAVEAAREQGVVITTNGHVDEASWQNAATLRDT